MGRALFFTSAFVLACGATAAEPPDAGIDTPSVGCTTSKSGLGTCTDYFTSDPNAANAACAQAGGTSAARCDHSNAVGGCLLTVDVNGTPVQIIYWYYFDTPSDIMAACAEAKAPYVSP
jgi:hypothetical protein